MTGATLFHILSSYITMTGQRAAPNDDSCQDSYIWGNTCDAMSSPTPMALICEVEVNPEDPEATCNDDVLNAMVAMVASAIWYIVKVDCFMLIFRYDFVLLLASSGRHSF